MKTSSQLTRISFRILLILCVLVAAILLFQYKYYYSFTFIMLIFCFAIVEFVYFFNNYFNQVNKVLLSLLYDDYSVELKKSSYNKTLNNAIDLYKKVKLNHVEQLPYKIIYNQILNSLVSGVLILKKNSEGNEVIFMNTFFCEYMALPETLNWSLVEERIPEFSDFLKDRDFSDFKTSLDIQVDKKERQTFVLQASNSIIQGQNYYIVLMDSIQRIMESKENEAWSSIMKVISHELMNSLAPIHSLSYNMKEILSQAQLMNEDKEDLVLSLDTIINRSNHLQDFVDRYRKLTMLPSPVLDKVNLNILLQSVLNNYQILFKDKSISIKVEADEAIDVQVDQAQFEQVLINLLTNSIHALEEMENREICFSIYKESKRVFVVISDSGRLIDESILPKIFLPFYTTRKTGAGIGLALSKSIIEAHNGYLYYQESEGRNTFVISLLV